MHVPLPWCSWVCAMLASPSSVDHGVRADAAPDADADGRGLRLVRRGPEDAVVSDSRLTLDDRVRIPADDGVESEERLRADSEARLDDLHGRLCVCGLCE